MARGGQNLKSKAMQAIKRELEFRTCVTGEKVPVSDLNDWCRSMNTLLGIRIVGTSFLRYAAKQLALARVVWKKPKEQEVLNQVAALLIAAEQRCADRVAKRAEKRALSGVLGIRLVGRPRKEDRIKTPLVIAQTPETPTSAQQSRRKLWESIAEGTNANRT